MSGHDAKTRTSCSYFRKGSQAGVELGSPIALVRPINVFLVLPGKQRGIGEQNLKVDTPKPSSRRAST